MRPQGSLRAAG
jgi:hypothetical protein